MSVGAFSMRTASRGSRRKDMQYRNKKTGTVINVNAEMGGNWERIAPAAHKVETKKTEPVKKRGSVKK